MPNVQDSFLPSTPTGRIDPHQDPAIHVECDRVHCLPNTVDSVHPPEANSGLALLVDDPGSEQRARFKISQGGEHATTKPASIGWLQPLAVRCVVCWFEAVRLNVYFEAAARGVREGREQASACDWPKYIESGDWVSSNPPSKVPPSSIRGDQKGAVSVGLVGLLAGMAFVLWMLVVIVQGTQVQGRVHLGVVSSAVGGFSAGGVVLEPVEAVGGSVRRMYLMVQAGGRYYPLYEPLVVEQQSSLVLLTLRNKKRFICTAEDETVCVRTADATQEIKAARPAASSQ
jgi:hypothetical protein